MSEQIITKTCTNCQKNLPLSNYYIDKRGKYSRYAHCKSCHYNATQKYRSTKQGKAVQKRYKQSEKGKAITKRFYQSEKGKMNQLKHTRQYKTNHPNRVKANRSVRQAIIDGKLESLAKLKCTCGEQAKHYHHNKGYAPEHWLDVIPVCIKCHHRSIVHIFKH